MKLRDEKDVREAPSTGRWATNKLAWWKIAISLFLAFNILSIASWTIPIENSLATPWMMKWNRFVRPYFLFVGLFQSWDTFAPSPWPANSYLEATIIYKDGSRKTWPFPRLDQMGLWERFQKERYRKFEENLQQNQFDILLPDVARKIARMNSTPEKPARTVILVQHYSVIGQGADGSYAPGEWQEHVLLGYGVKPEDLETDRPDAESGKPR
jgi:hypothetical protein